MKKITVMIKYEEYFLEVECLYRKKASRESFDASFGNWLPPKYADFEVRRIKNLGDEDFVFDSKDAYEIENLAYNKVMEEYE